MRTATVARQTQTRGGFWALSPRQEKKDWHLIWLYFVDRVRESDHLTLYRAVEEGVPTDTVVLLAKAFKQSPPYVLDMIGLPETTYQRKAKAGEALPEAAAHRAVALMRVFAMLRQLLEESGDPALTKDFDLEGWVSAWIRTPLPELGGDTPAALLRNPDGQRVIESLLERMRGGLPA